MANPFSGVITAAMKTLHKDMIDSLLYDDACTVPCTLIFEGNLQNIIVGSGSVDPIGNRPPGVLPFGGPTVGPPRSGVEPNEETDTLYLMVIWDSKDWIRTSFAATLVNSPEVFVQTLSTVANLVLLKQADRIIIDTDLEGKVRHTFTRYGEPEPCGLGPSTHMITMWKKIG